MAKSGSSTPEEQVSYLSCLSRGRSAGHAGHMVGVAQLAERLVVVQEVAGSTPVAHPHQDGMEPSKKEAVPEIRYGLLAFAALPRPTARAASRRTR